STNEVNTANVQVSIANSSVSTADSPDSTVNLSDAIVYTFLANQPNGSQLVHEDLKQIHEDDLEEMNLKWQLALLSMKAKGYFQRTGKKITINGSNTSGYDKSKSFMADEEVPTNMALMAFSDSETSRNLMEDMLPLGEEPEEEELLVKELLKLMCDKKNSVLFTDTACFVLFPDFKLPDESQVLLSNMYSVDMKNIVPKESLTCLVAKDTFDESMLWNRRLGHIYFKTINKLVKDNLVRGLLAKCFENDQTCVACLKGKQHKAYCKSKIQNSITQPLFMLHMDLFGPTFVSSLMNKKYCLVVTDDYSRFTWVFFLASKDETSGILKNFITERKSS
ncbi:putative ribonuclease H-like domain-containing protein, partial [Tanacetum coccineum]